MKYLYVFIVLLLGSNLGYTKMTLAKTIPPKVTKKIKINATEQIVWDYLLKFDNINEFGSKIIERSTVNDKGRNVVFKNGTIRHEELVYVNSQLKKMSIEVLNPGNASSKYYYVFEVKDKSEKACYISLNAYFDDGHQKSTLKNKIGQEFNILLKGLKHQFENYKGSIH